MDENNIDNNHDIEQPEQIIPEFNQQPQREQQPQQPSQIYDVGDGQVIVPPKKNKKWTTVVVVILVTVLLGISTFAAISYFYAEKTDEPGPEPTKPLGNSYTVDNPVVAANNKFAFDIYSQYKDSDRNIFLSPFSISSALAMTYEGAKGKTATEMQSVFGFPVDDTMRRTSYATIFEQLNKGDSKSTVSVANALWVDKEYKLHDKYIKVVSDYYGGEATNVDFKTATDQSRLQINKWVEGKTNNKIIDLIEEGLLLPNTRLILTNAIYFKGSWRNEFDKDNTKDKDFRLSTEKTIQAPTMSQYGNYYKYTEDDDQQVIELPYKGNKLSMTVILPKDGKQSAVEASLSATKISDWEKEMSSQKVNIFIPKFKIETSYKLSDTLKEMGMPLAFTDDADFSGMNAEGKDDLKIKEVIHKAFVDVGEEGTEAAAATAVIMVEKSVAIDEEEKPKIFRADHPFIFMIRDNENGNILFLGRINDPRA